MTSPSDLPLPTPEATRSVQTPKREEFVAVPGADLVITQDGTGQFLSFYWRQSEQYAIATEQVVGKPTNHLFCPFMPPAYLEIVQGVLGSMLPLRLEYPFICAEQYLIFDLTISPILMPCGTAATVIVLGQFLCIASREQAMQRIDQLVDVSSAAQVSPYPKQLAQVSREIRRSLDLETIWQQTAQGLGEGLAATRCLFCSYQPLDVALQVTADYCQPALQSKLGTEMAIDANAYLQQALSTLKPVVAPDFRLEPNEPPCSAFMIATPYQNQPNGLIILTQERAAYTWSDVEIDLLRDIADQVGTAIAHATLLAELQRANHSLMKQHQEIEDARQQAEAASRLKSDFLANTSHELRTPLNGMIGFLKLIMDGMADDPAEQNEFIQEAYRSAVHLLNIINDILDIAKIEAGKMQLELDPIKLDDLLTAVENFTRHQAQQKNLSFEILTPATRDEVILFGNYQRLLQVMLNLVGNAIKFTHDGGITISAEVIPKKVVVQNQEKPGMVQISVADTGIGVSLEKQDKLFQSFSQVDGSRTRQYGGTGLGLAISQKLVEAMGGVVNFYSMGEGLGSTVTFTVPLYQDPVMVTAPLPESADLLL